MNNLAWHSIVITTNKVINYILVYSVSSNLLNLHFITHLVSIMSLFTTLEKNTQDVWISCKRQYSHRVFVNVQ